MIIRLVECKRLFRSRVWVSVRVRNKQWSSAKLKVDVLAGCQWTCTVTGIVTV